MRDGRHVLDATDLEAGTGQRPDGRLGARSGVLLEVTPRPANADVDADDTLIEQVLADLIRYCRESQSQYSL